MFTSHECKRCNCTPCSVTFKPSIAKGTKGKCHLGVNPCLFSSNEWGHSFPLKSLLERNGTSLWVATKLAKTYQTWSFFLNTARLLSFLCTIHHSLPVIWNGADFLTFYLVLTGSADFHFHKWWQCFRFQSVYCCCTFLRLNINMEVP